MLRQKLDIERKMLTLVRDSPCTTPQYRVGFSNLFTLSRQPRHNGRVRTKAATVVALSTGSHGSKEYYLL